MRARIVAPSHAVAPGPWLPRARDTASTMPIPDSRSDHPTDPTAPPRSATWLEVVPVVLSSFSGIRKGKSMHRDTVSIRPQQVIVVGIVMAAILVTLLVLVVRFIIASAGA